MIVAGLACLLQDVYRSKTKDALDHRTLRRWLRLRPVVDEITEQVLVRGGRSSLTEGGFPSSNKIGVQPFLPSILEELGKVDPDFAANT